MERKEEGALKHTENIDKRLFKNVKHVREAHTVMYKAPCAVSIYSMKTSEIHLRGD